MGLERIDGDLPESWRRLRIQSVSACKLYYIRDGRNAWWGTWVTRWYVDSFYFDWESARLYAERQRTQGSVFHILEVPALMIKVSSGSGFALITQLGGDNPLGDYIPTVTNTQMKARLVSAPYWWRCCRDMAPVFVRKQLGYSGDWRFRAGHQLGRIMDSFREESLCWRPGSRVRDIVRLLGTVSDGYPNKLKPKEIMRSWESHSVGANYYLEWRMTPRPIESSAIYRLVRSAAHLAKPCG